MLNVHSFVVTKHRPWTTVNASVQGTELEILNLCPVKLMFLGDNRFGRLWRKMQPTQHVSTLQTGLLPVFPDAQPIEKETDPPTSTERGQQKPCSQCMMVHKPTCTKATFTVNNTALELQEPTVTTVNKATELILEIPSVITDNQNNVDLSDAMDKVVEHEDVSFMEPTNWLKFRDYMDLITG